MAEQAMSQAWYALVDRGGCVRVCRVACGTPGSRSSREDALKALGARLLKQYNAVGRQREAVAALLNDETKNCADSRSLKLEWRDI